MGNTENTEVKQILNLFFRIGVKIKEKQKKKHFTSMLCVRTLRFVMEKGEPTMKEVADYLGITPPSTTTMVDHYVKSGHLERLTDKNDRRIIRIGVTPKGKKFLKDGYENMLRIYQELLSKLNQKEINELKIILNKIANT